MKTRKVVKARIRNTVQATIWKECKGRDQPFTLDRRGGDTCMFLLDAAPGRTCLDLLVQKAICKTAGGTGGRGRLSTAHATRDVTAGPAVPGCVWSPGPPTPAGTPGWAVTSPLQPAGHLQRPSAGHFTNAHTSSENPRMWGTHMRRRSKSLGKPRVGAKGSWSQVSQMLSPTRSPVCFPRAGGLQARVLAHGCALQGWKGTGPFRPVRWAGLPGTGGMCPGEAMECHCKVPADGDCSREIKRR